MKKDYIYNGVPWFDQNNETVNVHGDWRNLGLFCPEGSLTHNSQCLFVFPLEKDGKTVPIYMGD